MREAAEKPPARGRARRGHRGARPQGQQGLPAGRGRVRFWRGRGRLHPGRSGEPGELHVLLPHPHQTPQQHQQGDAVAR